MFALAPVTAASFLVAIGLAGSAAVGSALATLVLRIENNAPLVYPRSHCLTCGVRIAIRDLIPIAGWFMLGARCRHCHVRVDSFYPIVEAVAVLIGALSVALVPAHAIATIFFGWQLLTLAAIDFRIQRLPNLLVGALAASGLTWQIVQNPRFPTDHVAAACLLAGFFVALAWSYRRFRGQSGIGVGDAKFAGAIALWLEPAALPETILLASAAALVAALVRLHLVRGAMIRDRLAFGPWLAAAAWATWLAQSGTPLLWRPI
jgi:leader peptidase (prepilin peptidase)/N-methyltransferase